MRQTGRWVRTAATALALAGVCLGTSFPAPLHLTRQQVQAAYFRLWTGHGYQTRALTAGQLSEVVGWVNRSRRVVSPAGPCAPLPTTGVVLEEGRGRQIIVNQIVGCADHTYASITTRSAGTYLYAQKALTAWLSGFDAAVHPRIPSGPITAVERIDGALGDVPGVERSTTTASALARVATLARAAATEPGVPEVAPAGSLQVMMQDVVMRSGWVLTFNSGTPIEVDATVVRCYEGGTCVEDAAYAQLGGAVVHAPGLVAALSSLVPAAWPGLTVSPWTLRPGVTMHVSGTGLYPPDAHPAITLRPLADPRAPARVLGTAAAASGQFQWTGAVPAGLRTGGYLLAAGSVGAEIVVQG